MNKRTKKTIREGDVCELFQHLDSLPPNLLSQLVPLTRLPPRLPGLRCSGGEGGDLPLHPQLPGVFEGGGDSFLLPHQVIW